MPTPQVLGFTNPDEFKAYFYKHFVRATVCANRGAIQVRVMFADRNWRHVFLRDGLAFDLERAERMNWIKQALEHPEEIRKAYRGPREVYVLTKKNWGEHFGVFVEATKRPDRWQFVTAYPLRLKTLLKIRCSPRIWP